MNENIDRRGSRISFRRILSPKRSTKIQNSHVCFGGGGGGRRLVETNFQLFMLSANLLKSEIPMSGGGGGLVETNFQKSTSNFLSPVLNCNFHWGGGGGWQSTSTKVYFKIQILSWNFHFWRGEGREGGWGEGGRVGHGMHGIWCCHLACIWGELADFDTKFCNTFWTSASQIVPFGN